MRRRRLASRRMDAIRSRTAGIPAASLPPRHVFVFCCRCYPPGGGTCSVNPTTGSPFLFTPLIDRRNYRILLSRSEIARRNFRRRAPASERPRDSPAPLRGLTSRLLPGCLPLLKKSSSRNSVAYCKLATVQGFIRKFFT